MEKKEIKDNFNENGIEDYVVENCNVSDTLRNNRKLLEYAKMQRNAEARRVEKYKCILGITISLFACISVIAVCFYLLRNETNEKGLEYCQSQGYSYEYCQRGL